MRRRPDPVTAKVWEIGNDLMNQERVRKAYVVIQPNYVRVSHRGSFS